MENTNASAPPSSPMSDISQRDAQLFAIATEINNLVGQGRESVARTLFTAVVRATGANGGRLFLTDEQSQPNYCLILADSHLQEYDAGTSPSLREQALAGWVFRQGRGRLIANTALDPRWASWAESPESSSAGSALAVPLLAAQPIGALSLVAAQPNHFGETDFVLIANLADQAAIVIENARLNALAAQSQNAIDLLLQTTRTISTSLDLEQILHTVLRQLTEVVPYQYAVIMLREGSRLRCVATTGLANVAGIAHSTFASGDIPIVFQALNQGRTIITGDEEGLADLGALSLPKPIRSWAIASLVARREILGGIVLASPDVQAHNPQTISTIDAFTDHVALAVANHRLAQEKDRRLRELAFLNETGQAISSTLDLDRILHLLLERVRDLLRIDAASIALRDEQTSNLTFEAASGEGATDVIGVQLSPGQGIAGWVAETGKPLIVQDVYNDARFFPDIDKKTGIKTQAILCIPIVLKGHVVGVIEALNPGDVPFDEQAIELLNALAGLAATAIDNARLFAQVRSAESRYEGLFEDSANPIIITDMKGIVIEVNRNACALLKQTKEELCGTNLTHLRSADDSLEFVTPFNQVLAGQETAFQTTILSNGQRVTVEVQGKKIQVKDTSLIQWIGRDISAEIALEQTRDDMVRMIIHDLRNPLANIMNSLDVLYDVITEGDDSVSLDEVLKIAKRSGRRMHQLISSILDISRLETGQAILETQPTDLIPVLNDAAEFIKPQTDIRGIRLTTSFTPNLPLVNIDSDMISRVTLNLLDNASKYTPIGGAISLTAHTVGAMVEVAVADNGPGIPADQLQSIFEKFTRVRQNNGPEGTGLGLAFCHLAVEHHGGHIWAESTIGQGTTIRFTLPTFDPAKAD